MVRRVWVLLLNWRNGQDTVDCLQSILDSGGQRVKGVVLCDNNSGDDSFSLVSEWAANAGVLLRLVERTASQDTTPSLDDLKALASQDRRGAWGIEFINTGANLGFAGGNNVGLRHILTVGLRDEAVLLLNNDTLLTTGALDSMLERLCSPQVGMCGATVVYHHSPSSVQAFAGASFQPWLARASHLGAHVAVSSPRDPAFVEPRLDYVLGAALMISRDCLEKIGLMDERYFLYCEEIDWATRAKRKGFKLAWAPDAVVLHKEGATIGSSSKAGQRSLLSEYHLVRSSILFTLKFYPYFLPTVVAYTMLKSCQLLMRRDLARVAVRTRAMLGLARVST